MPLVAKHNPPLGDGLSHLWRQPNKKPNTTQVVEVASSPESQDAVLAHRLWTLSEELAAPFLGPLGNDDDDDDEKAAEENKGGKSKMG
jgi:hypothetical protein